MKIASVLQIALTGTLLLSSQAIGQAEGNLVNLNDWTNQSLYLFNPAFAVQVTSPNSAQFNASLADNPPFAKLAVPILTGSVLTSVGETYEISGLIDWTAVNPVGGVNIRFGGGDNGVGLLFYPSGNGFISIPTNFNFLVVASSPITEMSIICGIDWPDRVFLSNFSVTEVPESSAAELLGLGIILFLAQQWHRLFRER
jgi:hypothetical protein